MQFLICFFSQGKVSIRTSTDPVGAPIFYRDVPLMPSETEKGIIKPLPNEAIKLIRWRVLNIGEAESRVVLKDMPTCANCHSFSLDGKTMGMDLDGPQNDKGLYAIAPVSPRVTIDSQNIVSWNPTQDRQVGLNRVGFMSQLSPDGKYVITKSADNMIHLWDISRGTETTLIKDTSVEGLGVVAFSPDMQYVASGRLTSNGDVHLLEVNTGNEKFHKTINAPVYSIAYSPEGKYIAVGGADNVVHILDAETGNEVASLPHEGIVRALSFSVDSKFVASGSDDKTARVWDLSTRKEVARIAYEIAISSVAFGPDNKYLAVGGCENYERPYCYQGSTVVSLWQPADLANKACEFATRNLTRNEWEQYIGDALPYQAVCESLPIEPEATTAPAVSP